MKLFDRLRGSGAVPPTATDPRVAPAPPPPPVVPVRTRAQVIGDGVAWTARWSGRWILIAIAAVLLGLLVGQLWSVLLPLTLAVILSSVLDQPVRWLERRLRLPPALAAATVLVGSLLAIVALAFAIAPSVAGQSGEIVDRAVAGVQDVREWISSNEFVTQEQVDAGLQAFQDGISGRGSDAAAGVLSGLGSVGSATVTVVVTLILTFLILKDAPRFAPWVRRLAGEPAGGHLSEVLGRAWRTLGGYLRAQALVSAIDAVLIGAGLLIVGVPLAIPLAILTFVGGFVPIVGAFVVGALAVLVALVSNGLTSALIVLGIIVLVQQIEGNVLSPWLQSKTMQLHPAVVLLSVILGSTLFGIAGAFLAVPAAAVAAVVLRYLDETATRTSIPAAPPPGSPGAP